MKGDAAIVVGTIMVVLGVYILWRAHRNKSSRINVEDLLIDSSLAPPRVTLAKFIGLGGWMAGTWWITYITFTGKFDGAAFAAYLAYCGAVKVAGDWVRPMDDRGVRGDDNYRNRPTL